VLLFFLQVKIANLQDLMTGQFDITRKTAESYNDYDYNVYHTYDEVCLLFD